MRRSWQTVSKFSNCHFMATFKAVVYADNRRQDGTYNVKIRVTHKRRSLKVSTHLYVTADDMTRGLKLKNEDIIDQADGIIRNWRSIVNGVGRSVEDMDVKQIVERIKAIERDDSVFRLDFIAFGREVAKRKSEGTARTYASAVNCLERYAHGHPVDVSKINASFLEGFEEFVRTEPALKYSPKHGVVKSDKSKDGGRAVSHYLACIRHIHNEAKKEFNDEDGGVIRIPQSPFKKYEIKKPPKTVKRAVSQKVIQAIINLPDIERKEGPPDTFTRRDLGRDCFLLSFALAGVNAADLYDADATVISEKSGDVLVYKRKKTRTRRDDEAEMHIRIEPCIALLVDKYKDPTGERLFCFHRKYSSATAFNNALRHGLQLVEGAIGAKKHFTFYSGRHSYATISRSKALNIDKYTVHEGLNHVDPEMKITDRYIKRDYSNIWEANAKLLALFDWTSLLNREMLR